MKRFLNTLQQDLLLAYRSGHVLITAILLAGMLALVVLLPRQVKVHNELILDATPDGALAAYLEAQGLGPDVITRDESSFRAQLEKQPSKVGVIFTGSVADPHFEIIVQNAVAENNLNLLQVSLDAAILTLRGETVPSLALEFLRPVSPPPTFNVRVIPIMLVFEVVLLGFFIAAVMIFQEKQEATLRAYRVTPAGAGNYILSKTALFIVLSLAYGLPLLLVGVGLNASYSLLAALIILSSALMTLFSLALAVFFRSLSDWFFVGVAVLVINSLPMISYGLPSFAPVWLTLIPSYPAVFATRDVLFNQAGLAQIAPALAYLGALTLAALAAAYTAVRYKLLKEGR
jgi:hypothetical protein